MTVLRTTLPLKLQVPPDLGGALHRGRLLDIVTGSTEAVVTIIAPAGYGKSTLLGQLASRMPNVAYLRLDETDDDPLTLIGDLLDAVETVIQLPAGVRTAIATPAEYTGFRAPARFSQALAAVPMPVSLLIDDCHLVRDRVALDWLGWIVEWLPTGVRLVLSSRREIDLPLGRLIAAGQLLRLGPRDLALDVAETEQLAALSGVTLTRGEAAALVTRTDGWPLAICLLLREVGGPARVADEAGLSLGEGDITRYLRSELLDRMDPETRGWVVRSSVLEELTGPLCDQALATSGSLRTLRRLEAGNQLLLPQDAGRTAYRYHALYREFLLAELEALPGERARVAARAADHLARAERVAEAVRYVDQTGDLDLLASYVERYATRLYWSGNMATVREWFARFDHDGVRERYATVAVLGGWAEALNGNWLGALRWLTAAERTTDRRIPFDGSSDLSGWVAALRANLMPNGRAAHAADVELGLERLHPASPMATAIRLQVIVSELMEGRIDSAEAAASTADEAHRAMGTAYSRVMLLGLRAGIAVTQGDVAAARDLASTGMRIVDQRGRADYASTMPLLAVAARVAVADGKTQVAAQHLAGLNRLRPLLNVALPFFAVYARLHAIRAANALREPAMARTLLGEVDDILRLRPDMGAVVIEVDQVRPVVGSSRSPLPGPWTLTAAELRLLAYLPTHLTFQEIARRMFLSPHTIKAQTVSIYGKLEASSRREAIERAVEVDLLDASVLHRTDGASRIA